MKDFDIRLKKSEYLAGEIVKGKLIFATDKGLTLANLERYEEAIQFYDRALALEPNDADILNNKASALYELGHFNLANEIFDVVRKTIR